MPSEGYERNRVAREREEAKKESREQLSILLQVYKDTTNHLAAENEAILLKAIFENLGLEFDTPAQIPEPIAVSED